MTSCTIEPWLRTRSTWRPAVSGCDRLKPASVRVTVASGAPTVLAVVPRVKRAGTTAGVGITVKVLSMPSRRCVCPLAAGMPQRAR